ncbi:MAG: universal stress protein [Methanomicrobiales archaeon]|nr:universal stress protein [Methanomicrobiales archaeon]
MRGTILVPLEMAESAEKILSAVEELARAGIEKVALLHVMSVRHTLADPAIRRYDEAKMKEWKDRLLACGVKAVTTGVVDGFPAYEILERSKDPDVSLVVMGSRGSTQLSRLLLGSTTEEVLHSVRKPLFVVRLQILEAEGGLVCRLSTDRLFRRILYATDFSKDALLCIPCLSWLAAARPEELIVAHIQDTRRLGHVTEEQMAEFNRRDTERLEALKEQFERAGFGKVTTVLRTGNAIAELLELARIREPTLIVMGAKGRTGVREMLLGGVTETIVHQAPVHVLVMR